MYQDFTPDFANLLKKADAFAVHERNIQALGIELYKVVNGFSSKIMSSVFTLKDSRRYPNENIFKTRNVRSLRNGTDFLSHLGPKIWAIIPERIKQLKSLILFSKEIKKWKPEKCPCRLCKTFVRGLGYLN